MTTPIWDFLLNYRREGMTRFHMPGHKGAAGPLGCEPWDITEVFGADALYEASGIIAESEANATALYGYNPTFYSTEGSSQCIRAMLHLALLHRPAGTPPVVVAARNVHKAFIYAAALLDFEAVWLWPEAESRSLCACPVTAEGLERTLKSLENPPAAVYITSPDYLGNMADIAALAEVCRRHKTLLLVDNAHGAYLRFLENSLHPLDLGADMCCGSAHKTLPVLTGGAYLHLSKKLPGCFRKDAKAALALFGSTSPSYLTLASLDLCNRYLTEEGPYRIQEAARRMAALKERLPLWGWSASGTEPLKLTLDAAAYGLTGDLAAESFRVDGGIEPEYADREDVVLMASGATDGEAFQAVENALRGMTAKRPIPRLPLPLAKGERAVSIREAVFAPRESIPVQDALGRICGAPTVACPPAIPIAVSGERIGPEALALFDHYGIERVEVLREKK